MNADMVGILSDTHDNIWALTAILRRFQEAGVSYVIHAGDFIAPFNAKYFADMDAEFLGVFGNNDGEKIGLTKAFSLVGDLHSGPHPLRIGGKRFLVMHEPGAVDSIAKSGDYDCVVYGHTHEVDIRTIPRASGDGETLVVNPGEGSGWVTGKATAVVIDLGTMSPETIEVPTHPSA